MIKVVTLFIVFSVSLQVNAQSLTEKELIGSWSVIRIYDVSNTAPSEMKQQMEMLQTAFLNSKFRFEESKDFIFDFPIEDMSINNSHWKLNNQTGNIIIQEWKDKDKEKSILMAIRAFKKDGKTIFVIEEAFFSLEVRKED